MPWCEDLDLELVWVDLEKVVVAADEDVRGVRGRERNEVVVVGIAADGRVRSGWIAEQGCLAGEIADESKRFVGGLVLPKPWPGEDLGDLAQQKW